MPNSDPTPDNDVLVREVARQIADAAPPAPTWDRLVRSGVSSEQTSSRPWRQLALVAAITAIVVSGLWLVARPAAAPEIPAEVPATVTLAPVSEPDSWAAWVAATDRFDVQLCHTRAVARITAGSELTAFADRVGDPGYTPERDRHAAFRAPVAAMAGLASHPGVDADDVASIAPVVEAWQMAESGYFGAEGDEPSESFVEDAAEAQRRVDAYLVAAIDPSACWFERPAVASVLDLGTGEEPTVIACLLSAQLDVGVTDFGTSADEADDELVRFLHAAWSDYADESPVALAELSASLEALIASPQPDRPSRADEVHAVLEPALGRDGDVCVSLLSGRTSTR